MEFTDGLPTSKNYRKWAAISAVAGALERRAYTLLANRPIFPNFYILLMGRPGTGKSFAIEEVRHLWAGTGKFNVAPDRVTSRALMNTMVRGLRHVGGGEMYSSALVASSEFGVLVSAYDQDFMSVLNTFYDCPTRPFEDETGKYGNLKIEKPHLNLISGAQPKFFAEIMPEAAYDLGFTSRLVMIYSAEIPKVRLFEPATIQEKIREERDALYKALENDLRSIAEIHGEFRFEKEAAEAFDDWNYYHDMEPKPEHPNLQNYNPRRIMTIAKLCMAFSISRDNQKVITMEDFEAAKTHLLAAEILMPQIFQEISRSTHGAEIEDLFHWMWQRYMKAGKNGKPQKKPIPYHLMMAFLRSRMPARDIPYTIGHMEKSGMIQKLTEGEDASVVFFRPLSREEQEV